MLKFQHLKKNRIYKMHFIKNRISISPINVLGDIITGISAAGHSV